MATRRRTAAGLRVVLKGRHDAPGLKRHAALRVVLEKKPKQGEQWSTPIIPHACLKVVCRIENQRYWKPSKGHPQRVN